MTLKKEEFEKQTGKKVVTYENAQALISPEIQKDLIQRSLPKNLSEENLGSSDSD